MPKKIEEKLKEAWKITLQLVSLGRIFPYSGEYLP
jgi:hypothetical protein